jgi:hypothetical protein
LIYLLRYYVEAFRVVVNSLPRLCAAQTDDRDGPQPPGLVKGAGAHLDDARTLEALSKDAPAALAAKPHVLSRPAAPVRRQGKAFGRNEHLQAEGAAGCTLAFAAAQT